MMYSEIIAVCSQIHTKHINTLCEQNVELLNVKPGGTYSDHWAVKGYLYRIHWSYDKQSDTQLLLSSCILCFHARPVNVHQFVDELT